MSNGTPPSPPAQPGAQSGSESSLVESLQGQLEECQARLSQALATNKGLYEYSVKMVTASTDSSQPGKRFKPLG